MLLVCDETEQIEVLRAAGGGYAVQPPIPVGKKNGNDECDLEALASEGRTVYAIGSHARVRHRPKPDEGRAAARLKLAAEPQADKKRDVLVRFKLAADGTAHDRDKTSLRGEIEGSDVLRPFAGLASKENGVDIEGVAVRGGKLFVGFRGPVLREGYVPVLVTEFAKAPEGVVFVRLGGLGVRDMEAVADGFLILAGPVGDGPEVYRVYHWDGRDCLPGPNPGACVPLCEMRPTEGAKPEGLVVRKEDAAGYEFVLVCDGVENGGPTAYRLDKKA
jgi:hypothetical protein